jgi:hypothetical protein
MSLNDLTAAHNHFTIAVSLDSQNKIFNIISLSIINIRLKKPANFKITPNEIENVPQKAVYYISCGLSALSKKDIDQAKYVYNNYTNCSYGNAFLK